MKIGVLATISLAFLLGLPLAASAGLGTDTDGDGVLDVNDNCSALAQAAGEFCDTDGDGYGNMCDGDFNNDFTVNPNDFTDFFVPDLLAPGAPPGPTGTDMNCDGVVNPNDFVDRFVPQLLAPVPNPGPSGLSCAGTGTPGSPCT